MRNRYLVSYDIADDRRLRRVHKTMLGYGIRVQYSVFCCDLSRRELLEMIAALSERILHREILIVDLGPPEGRGKECVEVLGWDSLPPEPGPGII